MHANFNSDRIQAALAGQSAAPREMSGLDHAVSGFGNALSEMDGALEQLEKRLYSVLRPVPPQPTGNDKTLAGVCPVQSPVVDQMQTLRAHLERLICRVNDIGNRFD
jgi:hypothetical protein